MSKVHCLSNKFRLLAPDGSQGSTHGKDLRRQWDAGFQVGIRHILYQWLKGSISKCCSIVSGCVVCVTPIQDQSGGPNSFPGQLLCKFDMVDMLDSGREELQLAINLRTRWVGYRHQEKSRAMIREKSRGDDQEIYQLTCCRSALHAKRAAPGFEMLPSTSSAM
jgi:hypothetical protein